MKVLDIDSLYVDQGGTHTVIGDRSIRSMYTSYGIKCIDSEYSRRIQNIGIPIKAIVNIERNNHTHGHYYNDYSFLDLDHDIIRYYEKLKFIYEEDLPTIPNVPEWSYDIRTEWIDALKAREYFDRTWGCTNVYTYTHPKYFVKHRGEDPVLLRKEIVTNKHLHKVIIKNLLSNLDTRSR